MVEKTLVAKTYEGFERLELPLLQQGFRLYDIVGRRMRYACCKGAEVIRIDIFMNFWEV